MDKKIIKLSGEEELKIFMSPVRQKIMRHMQVAGEALTPKSIADDLGLSPSSAQFHIKKLASLGIVELDHTKTINGIRAKYYRIAYADVRIGSVAKDSLSRERYIIMQNLIRDTFDGLVDFYENVSDESEILKNGDFLNGFLYLSREDSIRLLEMIRKFISEHELKKGDEDAWEYTLMIYNKSYGKRGRKV